MKIRVRMFFLHENAAPYEKNVRKIFRHKLNAEFKTDS